MAWTLGGADIRWGGHFCPPSAMALQAGARPSLRVLPPGNRPVRLAFWPLGGHNTVTLHADTFPRLCHAMPDEVFVLIPGRTSKQGCGISEGKFSDGYLSKTRTLQVSPADMQRLGLADGDRVRLRSESGEIEVAVTKSRADELPPGLLFIPYGDLSSRLMGGDTHGSGMPISKGIDVTLEKVGGNDEG